MYPASKTGKNPLDLIKHLNKDQLWVESTFKAVLGPIALFWILIEGVVLSLERKYERHRFSMKHTRLEFVLQL